jgi:hypothetical protein
MTEDGEMVRSIAQSSSVLILVHDDIEPPGKAILHSPMLAYEFQMRIPWIYAAYLVTAVQK